MSAGDPRRSMNRGDPIFRKEECSPFDIGVVFNDISTFDDGKKLKFIKEIWKPDQSFEFMVTEESGKKKRKFRREWLRDFPWLAYSKYLDGAFCLPCVFFGSNSKVDKLVKSPLTLWTSAVFRMKKHCSGQCESHNSAVIRMDNFIKTMTNQAVPVTTRSDC